MNMKIGWIDLKENLKRELKKELDHIYRTTDGKKFADREMAEAHQTIMDRLERYSKL